MENRLLVSYTDQKNICQFHSSEPKVKIANFMGLFFSKSYIGSTKNCGTSGGKLTPGFQFILGKILPISLKRVRRVKISNLMGLFYLKGALFQPKTLARVSSCDTKRPWRGLGGK